MVRGTVQGVGFRPHVFRLATEHNLAGWIQNSPQGVQMEVEGSWEDLESFLLQLENNHLPLASFHSIEPTVLDVAGYAGFEIRESLHEGVCTALVKSPSGVPGVNTSAAEIAIKPKYTA